MAKPARCAIDGAFLLGGFLGYAELIKWVVSSSYPLLTRLADYLETPTGMAFVKLKMLATVWRVACVSSSLDLRY